MKLLISGSGSGGHIYPCVAFINYLEKNNIEYQLVIFKEIDKKIYDLNQKKYIYVTENKIRTINKLVKSYDAVITFGGKNSLFLISLGKLSGKKTYIFEQNVVLGKANKCCYYIANRLFTTFKIGYKKESNLGNPKVDFEKRNEKINLFKNKKKTVLITMGSLGSSSVIKVIERLIKKCNDYNYILILGNNVSCNLVEKSNLIIYKFYNDLTKLFNASDIIISRAGATTLIEILSMKINGIIIPSPYVANNHQVKNALYLKDCFDIVFEENINENVLINLLKKYNDEAYCNNKKDAMNKYIKKDICKNILKIINEDLS